MTCATNSRALPLWSTTNALRQARLATTRRSLEEVVEPGVGHRQPGAIVEVGQVETEGSVGLEVDQMVENALRIPRRAVRREPHDLVLAGIHLEPRVIRKRRVQQAERVRKVDLATHFQRVAAPRRERRRGPFAHAVHRQNRRLVEGRREERARGVAQVMFREQQPVRPGLSRPGSAQFLDQQVAQKQLFPQPDGDRHAERFEPARRKCEIGLEKALEFEQRLVVERDEIDIVRRYACHAQTVFHRMCGKAGVVLPAREALFLSRSNDFAVVD